MLEALDAALECFATIFVDISWSRDKDKIVFDEDIIITVKNGEYLFDSEYFDETLNFGGDPILAAKELVLFVMESRIEGMAEYMEEEAGGGAEEAAPESVSQIQDNYRKNNKIKKK